MPKQKKTIGKATFTPDMMEPDEKIFAQLKDQAKAMWKQSRQFQEDLEKLKAVCKQKLWHITPEAQKRLTNLEYSFKVSRLELWNHIHNEYNAFGKAIGIRVNAAGTWVLVELPDTKENQLGRLMAFLGTD